MPYDFPKLSSSVSAPFSENAAKLAALFPSVVKDGKLDLDELRAQLGEFDEVGKEKYGLTWAGKSDAQKKTGEALVGKTLKYIEADSKNPETTQNIYIEGDNLEALKLLQNAYRGKVKMIYIDPPYNTGEDFVYNDSFVESADEAAVAEGDAAVVDGKIERYAVNTKTNGKYHANWLSMMYPRLQLARNLLSEDGVIFISIDDNEQANLKTLCDEIFGADNFIGIILWKKKTNGNNMGFIPPVHDYIICYSKDLMRITDLGYPISNEYIQKTFSNPDNDSRGAWTTSDLSANHKGPYFGITNPTTGEVHYPPEGRYWVFNEEEVNKRIIDGRIIFGKSGTGRPVQKVFLANRKFGKIRADSWWADKGMNEDATSEQAQLFMKTKLFTHPKPSKLLYNISKISTERDDIILDFFSGSATTAHAVMQLNAEDGGNRKFILVQLPEPCDEKSEAYKAGYKNICEIGKERIRRAGDKIKTEHPLAEIDTGFKVFRVDNTNIKWIARELAGDFSFTTETTPKTEQKTLGDIFGEPQTSRQNKDTIDFMPQTNDIDIVYEILLHQYDIPLTVEIEKCEHIGNRTYSAASAIIICLEDTITPEIIEKIAAVEPVPKKIFFRDSAFNDDISLKENAMLRLDALMQMHLTADTKGMKGRLPYSVEFL